MAVVESMLCGCIPVTTNGGALPEVTGDAGFRGDGDAELAAGVTSALDVSFEQRLRSREFAQKFSADVRGAQLRKNLALVANAT